MVITEEKEETEATHQDETVKESKELYAELAVKKIEGDSTDYSKLSIEETKAPLSTDDVSPLKKTESDLTADGQVVSDNSPDRDIEKPNPLGRMSINGQSPMRRSVAGRMSVRREGSEQAKQDLLARLEIEHAIQLDELSKKQEELKLQEIEAIKKKHQEARESIEIEMQESCN